MMQTSGPTIWGWSVDLDEIHYMITPWHGFLLALKAEQQAFAFFDEFRRSASDLGIKRLADEFAGEEEEHVALVLTELEKYPEPEETWDDDPDPRSRRSDNALRVHSLILRSENEHLACCA